MIARLSVGLQVRLRGAEIAALTAILPVDMPHDFRPPVHDRQHRIRLLRREHRDDARDAHLSEALHPEKADTVLPIVDRWAKIMRQVNG